MLLYTIIHVRAEPLDWLKGTDKLKNPFTFYNSQTEFTFEMESAEDVNLIWSGLQWYIKEAHV